MGMMRWQWIRDRFVSLADSLVPGLTGGILCRTRCIDEVIQRCVNEGATSVMNFGAGLDIRGLRLASLSRVRYYEIDRVDIADIVRYTQKKIAQYPRKFSRRFRLISIDFQEQSVETRLKAEGWTHNERTLFMLEGVIHYITPKAFHEILTLVSYAAEGSSVVFMYPMQDFLDGSADDGGIQRLRTCTRFAGIAQYNGFLPETLPHVLAPYSLDMLDDAGRKEYQQRVLQGLNRKLLVWDIERVAHARICH